MLLLAYEHTGFFQILYESRCSAPSTCFLRTSRLLFAAWQEVFGFVCLLLKRGLQWAKCSRCKFSDWQVNVTSKTFSEYYNAKSVFINVDLCSDPELNPSLTKNVQAHHFKLCVQGCVYFILFFNFFLYRNYIELLINIYHQYLLTSAWWGAQLRGPSLWFETNSLLTPFKIKVKIKPWIGKGGWEVTGAKQKPNIKLKEKFGAPSCTRLPSAELQKSSRIKSLLSA